MPQFSATITQTAALELIAGKSGSCPWVVPRARIHYTDLLLFALQSINGR